jgi:membrane-bound serine protease (ClpP class)
LKTRRVLAVAVLVGALLLSFGAGQARAQTSSSSYYVINLSANIDPGTETFVTSSISNAQSAGASHIVLVLNSVAGDDVSMDGIIQAMANYESSGGTFITLVGPLGAGAVDTGAFVAEASNDVYMMNGTTIGSANDVAATSVTGSTIAYVTYMQALTQYFGRNGSAASLMVSGDVSYVATDALRLGVINGLINASSVPKALAALGVPSGAPVENEGISAELISILSNPDLASVLFLAGVLAIMIDLVHPTFILSAAGAAAIVLALIGLGFFGAPISAVILMFIGAAFIFLEVKTGHGISAVGGVILFAIGVLLIFQNTVTPAPIATGISPPVAGVAPSPITFAILGVIGVVIVIGSIYLYKLRRDLNRRKTGLFELKRMIGKEGILTSDVKAKMTGTANIESEDWTVTSSQDLAKGARVKVKETDGYKLVVEGV